MASMVGGFMLAGEAEKALCRTMLLRLCTAARWVMASGSQRCSYMGVVLIMVLISGLLSGWAFFGLKPISYPAAVVSVWHGIWLILLANLVALGGIELHGLAVDVVSSFTDSGLTSAIVPMVIMIVVQILMQLSWFAALRPLLVHEPRGCLVCDPGRCR